MTLAYFSFSPSDTSLLCIITSTAQLHVSFSMPARMPAESFCSTWTCPGHSSESLRSSIYHVFFFFLLPSLRNSCPALRESPVSPSYSPAIPRFLCESVHDSGNPCWLRPRGLLLLLPHLYSSASPTSSSSHVYLSHLTHLGPHSHAP